MAVLYPTRYGTRLVTIDQLFAEHHVDKMHPEFARRLRCWLEAQGGNVGIGGSWRDDGSQPDKPGFAPEGKSFHQYQRFASGKVAFAAVDLVCRNGSKVHRAPRWDEVPVQGSADAARWGVHCNVSNESWHMQVIEIDGWLSWTRAGSPDPRPLRPIPCAEKDITMRLVDPPRRLLDTRVAGNRPKDGGTVTVDVPNVSAVFVNITIVGQAKAGYATAFANGRMKPATSNINYGSGGAICNTSWVPVGDDGRIAIYVHSACDVIVDLQAVAS